MSSTAALEFIERHGMSPARIDPARYGELMYQDMLRGLNGDENAMPMIPTYIKNEGELERNVSVAVIDAGGTNFRSGLATFTEEGCTLSQVEKHKMPGVDAPVTWEEFISFTADKLMPLMDKTALIGFCFSYNADITPEIDGLVRHIDKEVVVTGCEGKLVGAALTAELARRGVYGKRVFIINDTVAALLGSSYALDRRAYSGFAGQISGTGTNTCCAVAYNQIGKLAADSDARILINLESGMYAGFPQGDFDRVLDAQSNNPGSKFMEKLTAGAYLGELGRLMLCAAAEEGLLSAETAEKLRALDGIDASYIDAWACGEKLSLAASNDAEGEFVRTISLALFERSARCMCANLIGIMLLTGAGTQAERPMCVCAEGSLVDRSRHYRPMLEGFLDEYAAKALGRYAVLRVSRETTLPGSAVAALLNR